MRKRQSRGRAQELLPWQAEALQELSRAPIGSEATFGGATALSVVYLHHRQSQDIDLFLQREPRDLDLRPLARAMRRRHYAVEMRAQPPRLSMVLLLEESEIGHVDLAHYPYDPIERATRWQGLSVDSLTDLTVNKLQALLTRARDRDFVDLFFLLQDDPVQEVERLLSLARAKFDVGASRFTLAEKLLQAEAIVDLPKMLRPITLEDLQSFFGDLARSLIRKGP